MTDTKIQAVSSQEWPQLQAIAKTTFEETFAHQNEAQSMQTYLEEKFSKAQVRQELANPDSQFYFVWDQDEVVGYLKLNTGKAQTEPQPEPAMEIERIYVLSKCQGKKLGHALLRHALSQAQAQGVAYLWLGVWEENHRAIAFYERHGFEGFGEHLFYLGSEAQVDLMLRRYL